MLCSSQFRNRRLKILISGAAFGIVTCLVHIVHNTLDSSESKQLKKQKVLFFKSSGAAGDTFQNILFRYGESRHLRFALPEKGYEFGKAYRVHDSTESGDYDIMLHRAPLIFKRLKNIIPLSKSFYITVISHPEDVLRYLFSVYQSDIRQCLQIPETQSVLDQFLESPEKYIKMYLKRKCKRPILNPTLREFGMPAFKNTTDEKQISTVIANTWSRFDMVLVAEYLDEGLIFVKNHLELTFEDMAYVKLGVPSIFEHSRARDTLLRQQLKACFPTVVVLSKQKYHVVSFAMVERLTSKRVPNVVRDLLINPTRTVIAYFCVKRINSGDMKLYDFFVQRHLEQVAQYGERRMKNDVDELRKVRQHWQQTCIGALIPFAKLKSKVRQPSRLPTPNTFGYALTENGKKHALCRKMVRSETLYTDALRNEVETLK